VEPVQLTSVPDSTSVRQAAMVAAAQFWAGRDVDASQVLETAAAWSTACCPSG